MIKAIIFDCDGVLIESAEIKTCAFRKLFSRWPDKTDEIVHYHKKNMGISRYVKFKYFYENILKQPYTNEIGDALSGKFSELVIDEIKRAPLVKGTAEFLKTYYRQYLFLIASGTPQDELADIVETKGIDKYFSGIFGAPATKTEILNTIMHEYLFQKSQLVFVGDASSDKKSAEDAGIYFILRRTGENYDIASTTRYVISNMTELGNMLEVIEK